MEHLGLLTFRGATESKSHFGISSKEPSPYGGQHISTLLSSRFLMQLMLYTDSAIFSCESHTTTFDEKLNKIQIYNTHFKKKHYRICDHSFLEGTADFRILLSIWWIFFKKLNILNIVHHETNIKIATTIFSQRSKAISLQYKDFAYYRCFYINGKYWRHFFRNRRKI